VIDVRNPELGEGRLEQGNLVLVEPHTDIERVETELAHEPRQARQDLDAVRVDRDDDGAAWFQPLSLGCEEVQVEPFGEDIGAREVADAPNRAAEPLQQLDALRQARRQSYESRYATTRLCDRAEERHLGDEGLAGGYNGNAVDGVEHVRHEDGRQEQDDVGRKGLEP